MAADSYRDALAAGRDGAAALQYLHGPLELQAALLAMLLPPGSQRAAHAWQAQTAATPALQALRDAALALPAAARLPWFEQLLARMATQPLAARQALLEATRRVMSARGRIRALDRLHWLLMRLRLGGKSASSSGITAGSDDWLESDLLALARYSAFLSRMIPADDDSAAGTAWYQSVMAPWQAHLDIPPCQPPDGQALVLALNRLQTLSLVQRPRLLRGWTEAAVQRGRLQALAADALRISAALLASPLPPEVALCFTELPGRDHHDAHRD